MSCPLNVLIVEDCEDDALLLQRALRRGGLELGFCQRVYSTAAMKQALAERQWDLVLSDYVMPQFSGIEALKVLQESALDIPFILISGKVGEEAAVEAMKKGASDFVAKDNPARLVPAIERELKEARTRRERRLAETRLAQSETRFRTLFHSASDAIIYTDTDGTVLEVNDTACASLGFNREEMLGERFARFSDPQLPVVICGDAGHSRQQGGRILETNLIRRDGVAIPTEVNVRLIEHHGKPGLLLVARDIAERKRAEQQIVRLSNLYAALSQTNQAIVRTQDRSQLMAEITRVAVEYGHMDVAWIGTFDGDRIYPVACHGLPREYLEGFLVSWMEAGDELYRTVVKEARCYVANDYRASNHAFGRIASAAGVRSMAVQPLEQDGRVIGTLSLWSKEAHFFTEDFVDLLSEMALDISYALGHLRTETLRRMAEEKLRLSAQVFENSTEAILITDRDCCIVSVNRAFTEITGYSAEEVSGKNPRILSSGRQGPEFYRRLWESVNEHGYWRGEIVNRRKNGEIYPEWLTISAVRHGDEVAHYVGIFSDITERKKAERRIAYLAHYDVVTGLPNRTLLQGRMDFILDKAQRDRTGVALLFVDLDRFKSVNDSLGHDIGDALLREAARRLRHCVRRSDMVARWGGDEFIVVLTGLEHVEHAARIARKIIDVSQQPYRIDGNTLSVTPSIGVSVYPADGRNVADLIKHADMAMYRTKENGRNNFQFYTEEMNANVEERLAVENSLREALAKGEFLLHYQPQIDVASGRVTGVEALIRWRHPRHGLVSPDKFIPVAEECGLITEIGEWVLETACRQNSEWQAQFSADMPVAVNLSALQFRQHCIRERVEKILERSGLPARFLELEITERVWMNEKDGVLSTLKGFKNMGLQIAIDDFGTGYSCLSYLKHYPVDRLKVDKSFVRDISHDPDDAAIVTAIIHLAHSLRLRVIAEGVETEEQMAFLREHGCNEMQGFYFSKPLDAGAMTEFLKSHGLTGPPLRITSGCARR